jgi:CRISPR-associated protein Cas1
MAASLTVQQDSSSHNPCTPPLVPHRGVLTLFGYGIKVRLDRGHLVIEDGIGSHRRVARLPRVGHGLRRLIVIGSDGMVSLAAMRWLADQKAAFVMLNRNGSVLVATGPVGPKDARLRRAQALAFASGVAVDLSRDLIERKLAAQERNVRSYFNHEAAAEKIRVTRDRLSTASTIADMRLLEAEAALAYWGCWRALPVRFPTADLRRVPDHWRHFGSRVSPLTGSPRLSVTPANAMLNYLYAVLESEARLAAVSLGLDPGLGVMHLDTDARDSLACDLMEPIRAEVDAYVLTWLRQQPLRREWFFEERNGCCRLMGSFVERLSATAPTWADAVAPIAEGVAKVLWSTVSRSTRRSGPKTPLTQRNRREAKGAALAPIARPPKPPRVCVGCGTPLRYSTHCHRCGVTESTKRLIRAAEKGRIAASTSDALARLAETQRRHAAAQRAWDPSEQPAWLTPQAYVKRIQPRLRAVSVSRVMSALGVSRPYAVAIRLGRRRPHPRHWANLAALAGVTSVSKDGASGG